MKIVTLLSGGLDSTTLAYHLGADLENEVLPVSFNYGQRHSKELEVAAVIADSVGWVHRVVDLTSVGAYLKGSSLTDDSVAVPDGHYASETMKQTVVPNRNAIMLSIAYGIAVAEGADAVAFAAHSGDHAIYPDCRPEFVSALEHALRMGNLWAEPTPNILMPFIHWSKADIARDAELHKVPVEKTWSCYKGGIIHCGVCGTCYERREAFQLAGIDDPTPYNDSTTIFAAPT